jgi:hypothetical protein
MSFCKKLLQNLLRAGAGSIFFRGWIRIRNAAGHSDSDTIFTLSSDSWSAAEG